jgi:hypothetical protein
MLNCILGKTCESVNSSLMNMVFDALRVRVSDLLFDAESAKEFDDGKVSLLNRLR